MKKGQGLPITTIVIAALAILVLVILFAITTGRLGTFAGATSECPGECLASVTLADYGINAWVPGTLVDYTKKTSCDTTYQKRLFGNYIAMGLRGEPTSKNANQPIPCKVCCASAV